MKNQFALVDAGEIINELHYGPFANNWWVLSNQQILPYRVDMNVLIETNDISFSLQIIRDSSNVAKPFFHYKMNELSGSSDSPSGAISQMFKKLNKKGKIYSGPSMMGFDHPEVIEELLLDVNFQPFKINVSERIQIFVSQIGNYWNTKWNGVGEGFCSSFSSKYKQRWSLFVQKIISNHCTIEIYQDNLKVTEFEDVTPEGVWNKTGILKDHNGNDLFGVFHEKTIEEFNKYHVNNRTSSCTLNDWNNSELMEKIYEQCLKKRIATKNLDWFSFFQDYKSQKSNIIELFSALSQIYPKNYSITKREIRAWKTMLKRVGCINITPISIGYSNVITFVNSIFCCQINYLYNISLFL
ncbi:MAG: hypothetical protein QOK71_03975 [Nitrososphaeraceae archaeon]|jgi:hypothetical protein|nr:hypothetical protein [Nitrososphaeraceae archaeon]